MFDSITGIEDPKIKRSVVRMFWLFVFGIFILIALNLVVSLLFFPEAIEAISIQNLIMFPFLVMILSGYTA